MQEAQVLDAEVELGPRVRFEFEYRDWANVGVSDADDVDGRIEPDLVEPVGGSWDGDVIQVARHLGAAEAVDGDQCANGLAGLGLVGAALLEGHGRDVVLSLLILPLLFLLVSGLFGFLGNLTERKVVRRGRADRMESHPSA